MNIFFLSYEPIDAARFHCDTHAVKMVLESAQLLCNAHYILDNNTSPLLYKPTHLHHPCTKWCAETLMNYNYTYKLFIALSKEYSFRFNRTHKTYNALSEILKRPPNNIPGLLMTVPIAVMPDEYKLDDPVDSYRNYYRQGKRHLLTYTKREPPHWLKDI